MTAAVSNWSGVAVFTIPLLSAVVGGCVLGWLEYRDTRR